MENICCVCEFTIHESEDYTRYNSKSFCVDCSIGLLAHISQYKDFGGWVWLIVTTLRMHRFKLYKKKLPTVTNYRKVFNELKNKYGAKCKLCNAVENLTIDHIMPRSKGGTDEFGNLQILCKTCNSRKGAKIE